jgi:hypothetical protein
MSSARQIVISTLRQLTRQCIAEQAELRILGMRQRKVNRELDRLQLACRAKLKQTKLRIDRELKAHKDLLGVEQGDNDREGESWKA